MPIPTDISTATRMAGTEACNSQLLINVTAIETPRPTRMPAKPPVTQSSIGLDEKLLQDVMAAGADGHSQADFPRAFRHRDEHDVHDPDATHHQRDRHHDQQLGCHEQHGRGYQPGDSGHVADDEVIGLAGRDAVALAK